MKYEKERLDSARSAALMDIQIHTAIGHSRWEEAFENKASETLDEAMSNLEQAIDLDGALLHGGKTEHMYISEPLKNKQLRPKWKRSSP